MIPSRRIGADLAWGAAAAVAACILAVVLGPPDTFWTVDDAGKDLVLRNLLRHPATAALDYPGRPLDPEFRVFPLPLDGSEAYAARHAGAVISQYAAPFVWLAWPLATASLPLARILLPALAAGIAVALAFRMAARLGKRRLTGHLGAALLLAATPLAFYGSLFWEHTTTIALVAGAFLALTDPDRPRPVPAGLLLGAAILLREELGLLAIAVVVAAAGDGPPFRRARGVALGAAAGVAARLAFHQATSGTWLGIHAALNRPEAFAHGGRTVNRLLLGPGPSGAEAWMVGGALLLLAAGAWWRGRTTRTAAADSAVAAGAIALAAISATALLRFPGREDAALALRDSNSALLFLPWALAAPFVARRGGSEESADAERLLGRAVLVFLVLFAALVPPRSVTGVHPGPRMLLPVLPFVAALAAVRLAAPGVARLALVPCALCALAWNVRSLELLHTKRELSGELARTLAARPEDVVVTDLFWLPTDMGPLWDTKRFFLLSGDRDLAWIVERARAAGVHSVLAAVAPGRIEAEPVARVRSAALPDFSVDLHELRLERPEAPSP